MTFEEAFEKFGRGGPVAKQVEGTPLEAPVAWLAHQYLLNRARVEDAVVYFADPSSDKARRPAPLRPRAGLLRACRPQRPDTPTALLTRPPPWARLCGPFLCGRAQLLPPLHPQIAPHAKTLGAITQGKRAGPVCGPPCPVLSLSACPLFGPSRRRCSPRPRWGARQERLEPRAGLVRHVERPPAPPPPAPARLQLLEPPPPARHPAGARSSAPAWTPS